MFNILSIVVGLVALMLALPALVPLFGWVNYLVIPVALIGAAIGALSSRNAGRNLNLLVLAVGTIRLALGGFVF